MQSSPLTRLQYLLQACTECGALGSAQSRSGSAVAAFQLFRKTEAIFLCCPPSFSLYACNVFVFDYFQKGFRLLRPIRTRHFYWRSSGHVKCRCRIKGVSVTVLQYTSMWMPPHERAKTLSPYWRFGVSITCFLLPYLGFSDSSGHGKAASEAGKLNATNANSLQASNHDWRLQLQTWNNIHGR